LTSKYGSLPLKTGDLASLLRKAASEKVHYVHTAKDSSDGAVQDSRNELQQPIK